MVAAFANTVYLFTRTRLYQLYHAHEPVSSPNARFVRRESSPVEHLEPERGLVSLVFNYMWHGLALSARFLLNLTPPKDQQVRVAERIQVLEKWDPQLFEMTLFSVYSPVHAWLWLAMTSANWILIGMIMVIVGAQVRSFQQLCIIHS